MKLHKGAPDFRVTLLNDVVWSSEQLLCHSSTHVTWCCLKLAKYRFWWWIQKAQVTGANTLPVFFMSDFAKNLTSLPAVFLVAHRCTWVSKMSGLNSRMATCSQRGSWLPTGSEECIASVQSLETQFCWCGLPRTSSRFVFPKSFNHGLHRGLEDYRLGSYALWCRSWRTRTKFGSCLCLIGFWRGPYSRRSPSRQCLCTTSSWWKKCERGSACLAWLGILACKMTMTMMKRCNLWVGFTGNLGVGQVGK